MSLTHFDVVSRLHEHFSHIGNIMAGNSTNCKIPIITWKPRPQGLFLVKGPFLKIFLGGGLYMDEYVHFILKMLFLLKRLLFFEIFCSQPDFITEFFTFFIFNKVLTTVNTTLLVKKIPTPFLEVQR